MGHRSAPYSAVVERFAPLFLPATIGVVGVSAKEVAQGNLFIRRLVQAGFRGAIYPIHPRTGTLEGLASYPSLGETPEPIDYAFVAVPAEQVPQVLAAGRGRVRYAQVMSSGFSEDPDLSRELVDVARQGGMRLLGPNCMGVYSPRGRVSFIDGGVDAAGSVGVISQSGGLAMDALRHGRNRGVRFSGLVSLGNCADVGVSDLLEYFLADPDTRVIGAYIEDIPDGRRFFEQLRAANARKPTIILKGGRTRQGQRAAAAHTGSLAGGDYVWTALAKQTGSILVDDLEQLVDALVAFQGCKLVAAPPSGRVILFGNGGGASVLATDCLARLGLDVPPIGSATAEALASLHLPAGASTVNPIDIPANILQRDRGALARRILEIVGTNESPDVIMVHLNLPVILGYRHVDMLDDLIAAILQTHRMLEARGNLVLVLRSTGAQDIEQRKRECIRQATGAGIPVFDRLSDAAHAISFLHTHAQFRHARVETIRDA